MAVARECTDRTNCTDCALTVNKRSEIGGVGVGVGVGPLRTVSGLHDETL